MTTQSRPPKLTELLQDSLLKPLPVMAISAVLSPLVGEIAVTSGVKQDQNPKEKREVSSPIGPVQPAPTDAHASLGAAEEKCEIFNCLFEKSFASGTTT